MINSNVHLQIQMFLPFSTTKSFDSQGKRIWVPEIREPLILFLKFWATLNHKVILSCLSFIFAWIFTVAFSEAFAFILPWISSSPMPYASYTLMTIGLFVSPAVLGSISGQHLAFNFLRKKPSNWNFNNMEL